mmetsp:Transcript_5941/g.24076  ORF Transcript_5941/g.24076 Transcript_5941/m.24076 type:complete len:177 (-) Transcript_5941:2241-2771(-)
MAELHVVGEIVGAMGFEDRNLFCKWGLEAGSMWELVEGESGGQTHCDYPPEGEPCVVWAHPVDAHFAAKSLVGWPKMWFQVWSMDAHGAKDLAGYGFAHVPTAAGEHELDVATWCPEGTAAEKLSAFFVGGRPRLKFEEVIHQPGDRFRLQTKAAGVVRLRLGVCVKDFDKYNVRH